MHIGIAGPLGTGDVEHLLDGDTSGLPREMKGATLLVTLISELIRAGHTVSAYTTDGALAPRRGNRVVARGTRLTVHYVPRRRRSFRPDRGARGRMLDLFALERRELTEAIHTDRPDIVHAHWTYEFALAALDTGLPCLVTCHDAPWTILRIHRDLYRTGRLLMARWALRQTRHATVVSPYLIDELSRMTEAALEVVPNPIPEHIFSAGKVRGGRNFQGHPPQIAMLLSDWSSRKNPKPAMLAMRLIRERHPDARMHLYGSGFGPRDEAERWAAQQGLLECFVFHGWTPHGEAMRQLAEMDILVHPAIEESFGLTVAEAMALGLPVVGGKNSGAVPWVLGGAEGGGLLVDVRSAEQIADALRSLLDNPALYEYCSEQGRQLASRRFSPEAVTHSYLQHYERVLADRLPPSVCVSEMRT